MIIDLYGLRNRLIQTLTIIALTILPRLILIIWIVVFLIVIHSYVGLDHLKFRLTFNLFHAFINWNSRFWELLLFLIFVVFIQGDVIFQIHMIDIALTFILIFIIYVYSFFLRGNQLLLGYHLGQSRMLRILETRCAHILSILWRFSNDFLISINLRILSDKVGIFTKRHALPRFVFDHCCIMLGCAFSSFEGIFIFIIILVIYLGFCFFHGFLNCHR